jgi:hypothetical protein
MHEFLYNYLIFKKEIKETDKNNKTNLKKFFSNKI